MPDQMMTTSNLLSILWFRCVGCDARICSRFHLFVHFVSCAFTANLRDNNEATIQRTHTKFQGVVTPNRTRKISLKTRKNWEKKTTRNTPKVILIIAAWLNLNMLILFDLSRPMIFLFVNIHTQDMLYTEPINRKVYRRLVEYDACK